MLKKPLIAQSWQSFSDEIGLEAAHLVQRQEMKRAYYAGALGLLNIVATEMQTDTFGNAMIARLKDEFRDFADGVMAGRE
jgi:hypothetical protein